MNVKVIDSFWVGRLGFVKFSNGFETKIKAGVAMDAADEQSAVQEVIRSGYDVPHVYLAQFLDLSSIGSGEYQQMEE